jgi:Dehydrogenases (flavoproteins)
MHQGVRAVRIEEDTNGVKADLSDGTRMNARFLIGADGSNSQIARWSGLRKSWSPNQYVLCANEDIPYSPQAIESFYGEKIPLFVSLRFKGLEGYGWVFPKREYICVGIGGRVGPGADIRALLREFVERSREVKLIPPDLQISNPDYALDPAGAIHSMKSLTRGRTILIGDAAGFVSGSTGEGIYPGMVSGQLPPTSCMKRLQAVLRCFGIQPALAWRTRRLPAIASWRRPETVDRFTNRSDLQITACVCNCRPHLPVWRAAQCRHIPEGPVTSKF